jgi:lysophospholipase L1-like esterase
MTKLLFPTLFCLLLIFSCTQDEDLTQVNKTPSNSINKIMALGASRVEGARPDFESYRYELWKNLIEGGWTFDFVGTMSDEASYPAYQGNNFDIDHEGRGGWTSGQILDGIDQWLGLVGAPDIVLFSSPGGNDGLEGLSYEQAVSNVNAIIDIIQAVNPNVTIIIEQLAPAKSEVMSPQLTTFLKQMQKDVLTMANDQTSSTSKVIAVDMFTGFSDALLADDVHYNKEGAIFIADRYYNLLVTLLEN